MADMMNFPKRWEDFLHDYEFEDSRRVYTNGSRLIPSFRVEQMMEHYALRPVSREQVEKVWRGEWLHPHWHNSESCADCSRCNADVGHREFRGVQTEYNFCPVCGAAQNDEAVEMVMERLEALKDGKDD